MMDDNEIFFGNLVIIAAKTPFIVFICSKLQKGSDWIDGSNYNNE